jgi:hypothetical protein
VVERALSIMKSIIYSLSLVLKRHNHHARYSTSQRDIPFGAASVACPTTLPKLSTCAAGGLIVF